MSKLGKKMLLLSLMLSLLVVIYLAVTQGMSSLNQYFLQTFVDSWSKSGKDPDTEEWGKAQSFLNKALFWHDSSPSLQQMGGDLFLWKANIEKNGLQRNQALRQALAYFQQSIRMRPAYGYSWLSYAVVKDKLGQRDDRFRAAMARLDVLGKYEPAVLLGAVQIRFNHLSELGLEERKSLKKQIRRLATVDPKNLIQTAKRYNLKYYLCYRIKGIQAVDDFCAS